MTDRAFQTQCPSCSTRFSVNERQLTVASGKVRCGVCLKVFKAHEHIPIPQSSLKETLSSEQAPLVADIKKGKATSKTHKPARSSVKKVDIDILAQHLDFIDLEKQNASSKAINDGNLGHKSLIKNEESIPFIPSESIFLEGQLKQRPAKSHFATRFLQWSCISLLTVLLILQSGYLLREYGLKSVTWQPIYHAVYTVLGRKAPIPFSEDDIQVYEVHLQPHESINDALRFSFLLKNRSQSAHPFPALMLTFTDFKERQVASRTFQPWDYVDLSRFDHHLMPAEQPIQIQLDILNLGIRAVGYQVDVKAPAKSG
jgi:predicted Zn finger-like uncharacterized protein